MPLGLNSSSDTSFLCFLHAFLCFLHAIYNSLAMVKTVFTGLPDAISKFLACTVPFLDVIGLSTIWWKMAE